MAEREFDIILWGATGFTGQPVAQYLLETYGTGGSLHWAIAGRNRAKLERLRAEHLPAAQREALPIVLADSDDRASLDAMAARTRVICATVGPYALHGTPLVAACIDAGTDYCDLTGEVHWMARLLLEYESMARDSGARIVHTCGFDSVPFDMGVWRLQQLMHERHGSYAARVKGRVVASRGGASGGTVASMLNLLAEAQHDPAVRRVAADPYALYPAGSPPGPDAPDQRGAAFDVDFGQWTSPFIMAAINTRVVRRSNALLGFPWGGDFCYDEAVLNRSRARAVLASVGHNVGLVTLALPPTRALVARFLPKPGEGPGHELRESGFFELLFLGLDPHDRTRDTWLRVYGQRDPGYGATSRMLGEAAVCLAQDEPLTGGGFWTPASALAGPYLERLQRSAGLSFEPVDPPRPATAGSAARR